jgi:hypothetical protein
MCVCVCVRVCVCVCVCVFKSLNTARNGAFFSTILNILQYNSALILCIQGTSYLLHFSYAYQLLVARERGREMLQLCCSSVAAMLQLLVARERGREMSVRI